MYQSNITFKPSGLDCHKPEPICQCADYRLQTPYLRFCEMTSETTLCPVSPNSPRSLKDIRLTRTQIQATKSHKTKHYRILNQYDTKLINMGCWVTFTPRRILTLSSSSRPKETLLVVLSPDPISFLLQLC